MRHCGFCVNFQKILTNTIVMRGKIMMKQQFSAVHSGGIPAYELKITNPKLKNFAPPLNFISKV